MISELDIYRAANLVIKRHSGDAVIEAARTVTRMLELGDPEGAPYGSASSVRLTCCRRRKRRRRRDRVRLRTKNKFRFV